MSASVAPTLCDRCSPIFQGSYFSMIGHYGDHHDSIQSLEQAADKNCIICRDVWKELVGRSDFDRENLDAEAVRVGYLTRYWMNEGSVNVCYCLRELVYHSYQYLETQLEHQTPLHASPTWTGSTSDLQAPKKWLSQCLRTHSKCQTANDFKARSPRESTATRLLHIEHMVEDRVRLLINPFSDPAFAPPYATLSHCWGQDPFFMLTKGTKDELMRGIQTSILSQTFQDAISVAKSLEIQYIWIDSLCIIQDSDKDWDEQAPLMNEIYSHACLCIAATASAKSSSGLFRTREASSRVTCEVTISWSDRPNGVYQIYNKDIWANAFEDQPLMTRAWVVQELQLAPRILYFNSNQMFWQCHDKLACEELPRHIIPNELVASNQENNFILSTYDYHHQSLNKNRDLPMIRGNDTMFLWCAILGQYTNCHLTFPKDKLVAISGLAKLFCGPLSDTYCAGLWIRRMPIELLWERRFRGRPKPPLPKSTRVCYRAPSWSWASMDGPVTPSFLYEVPRNYVVILVEIKSCHATTKTGDPFSEVSSGVIQLSGFLSKVQLQPVSDSQSVTYWSAFVNGVWLGHADRWSLPRVVLDHKPPDLQEMFCFPILLQNEVMDGWLPECIILVAVEGKKDTFERLGRLTIPVRELLANYRRSELGGVDSDSELEDEDSHLEVQSRDSAWHHFILSWSKHYVTDIEPDDSLEFETIAVPGAVEISIE